MVVRSTITPFLRKAAGSMRQAGRVGTSALEMAQAGLWNVVNAAAVRGLRPAKACAASLVCSALRRLLVHTPLRRYAPDRDVRALPLTNSRPLVPTIGW